MSIARERPRFGVSRPGTRGEFFPAIVLALLLLALLWRADQPLTENYIGRQVPTAMVARGLLRGGSPLAPELLSGPFPNYFLVEFPLQQLLAVAAVRLVGIPLDAAGRMVSALAAVTAAWCIARLSTACFGRATGRWALLVFATSPLTIRYGRAFQPDMLMLAALLLGLERFRAWMEHDSRWAAAAGGLATAVGLLVKVIDAPILIVFGWLAWDRFGASCWRRKSLWIFAAAVLLPSLVWYVHAWRLAHAVALAGGSRSAALNWRALDYWIVPSAWLRREWLAALARFLLYRSFGPIGTFLLAVAALRTGSRAGGECAGTRMLAVWSLALGIYGVSFAAKFHHEYYLLPFSPLVAIILGRMLAELFKEGDAWEARTGEILLTLGLATTALFTLVRTTSVPLEWADAPELARRVRAWTPPDALVIAPDCVLYYAGRFGYRLEYTAASLDRLSLDWPEGPRLRQPRDLVAYYRGHGARYFADCAASGDPDRLALWSYLRSHYRVLEEQPGRSLLVAL